MALALRMQPLPMTTDGERLQKVLARLGFGSRRVCEDMISEGRVSVDGTVARLGDRLGPGQNLAVDGAIVGHSPDLVHYLLNKPPGVVCSADDEHGRPQAVDLVPPEPRVFTVGRLDMDSEGLIIVTNDGDLAHLLTHPSHGVEKEYLAEVRPLGRGTPRHSEVAVPAAALANLRRGVDLDDGVTAPAKVSQPAPGVVRITVHEGRNRQVRRMFEAVGWEVTRLVRVRIGSVTDRSLAPGSWRPLSAGEVITLRAATAPPRRRLSKGPRDGR